MPPCDWTISASPPALMASPAPPSASGRCSAVSSWTVASIRASGPATWCSRWRTTPTSRSSRCSTTRRRTRLRSARPCGPARQLGGGWLGWVVAVDDIASLEKRLGREAVDGNRHRPDGTELRWKQIGVNGLLVRPAAAVLRAVGQRRRPAPVGRRQRRVVAGRLEIAGDPRRVSEWLGVTGRGPLEDVKVEWVAPQRHPRHHRRAVPDPERPGPGLRLPGGERQQARPTASCRPRTSGTTRRPTSSRTAPPTPTA